MRDVITHSGGQHGSLGRSIWTGLSYTWHNRLILALLALAAFGSIFGRSYQNLLPAFSRDIWHVGPQGYGLLLAAAGGGALVGAFGLAFLKHVPNQDAVMLVGGLVFSLSLILFSLSPFFVFGLLLLFIVGITSTIFSTIIATFIQLSVPNEMCGRVMSLYTVTLTRWAQWAVERWLNGLAASKVLHMRCYWEQLF